MEKGYPNVHQLLAPLARGATTTLTCSSKASWSAASLRPLHHRPGPPRTWMIAFEYHEEHTLTHGYEPTREDALAAFAKS